MVTDARQRDPPRAAGPCVPADRRARRRQDHRPRGCIAKALNCIGPDGQGGPTIDPCGVCEPCRRHRRGALHRRDRDGRREPYRRRRHARASSTSSRNDRASSRASRSTSSTKSTCCRSNAFNALLKTLEEPAGEREVPDRDDRGQQGAGDGAVALPALRPAAYPGGNAGDAFRRMWSQAEGVTAEPEALAADRARGGRVGARRVCRSSTRRSRMPTWRAVRTAWSPPTRCATCSACQRSRRDPRHDGAVARWRCARRAGRRCGGNMISASTRSASCAGCSRPCMRRLSPSWAVAAEAGQASRGARSARGEWAGTLSFAALHRLWQLLLKGHDEVGPRRDADRGVRNGAAAAGHPCIDLPDPGDLARMISESGASPPVVATPCRHPGAAPQLARPSRRAAGRRSRRSLTLLESVRQNLAFLASRVKQLRQPLSALRRTRAGPQLRRRPLPADLIGELRGVTEAGHTGAQMWRITTAPTAGEHRRCASFGRRAAHYEAFKAEISRESPLVAGGN